MNFGKYGVKKIAAFFCACAVTAAAGGAGVSAAFGSAVYADTDSIVINIDTSSGHKYISPYIYGISAECDLSDVKANAVKQSDPRVSSYNWENNFSVSGGRNTLSLVSSYSGNSLREPALYAESLVSSARRHKIPSKYVTLQMAEYVAGSGNGSREKVMFSKNDAYLSSPELSDGVVYMDEYVSFLVNKYGYAADGGINGYFLGSEPENRAELFQNSESSAITAEKLVSDSAELAHSVKKIDPTALIYGPSLNGIEAFINIKNPSDWENYSNEYSWFIDYYLAGMKAASDAEGTRLLDVLDLHYYTEATNGMLRPIIDSSDELSDATRLQAPRILWDSSYTENSAAAIMHNQHIPLIPTLEASIDMYYPGTRLSFSEYNFGGCDRISGGIAAADTLGIFASHNVHMACAKPNSEDISYIKSAINIYTNYDGNGSGFGNTLVRSDGGDIMTSVYAALENGDESALRIILINKNKLAVKSAEINIKSVSDFTDVEIYSFGGDSAEIVRSENIMGISDNSFAFDMQPLSVYMLVLNGMEDIIDGLPVTGETNETSGAVSGTNGNAADPTETSTSVHEHVDASTYSPAVTSENPYDGEKDETPASDFTAVTSVGETLFGETLSGDGNTDPSAGLYGSEEKHVPAAVKVIVGILVAAVVLAMGYILLNDYLTGKKRM